MKRETAMLYFEAGLLTGCEVQPAPMDEGYVLELRHRDHGKQLLSVAREARTKVYKTLDAAATDARAIGFRVVTVYMP